MSDLQVRETRAVAQANPVAHQEVLRTDIKVPYITLAQPTSESVAAGKARAGDFVRSTNHEVVAPNGHTLEAIFLHAPKADWVIENKPKGAQRWQYVKSEIRNAANETLPWSWFGDDDGNEMQENERGAMEWRRVKRLTVFAILPADILAAEAEMKKLDDGDLPDPSKALSPVVFSFRSTSYDAGKDISTFFAKARSMKVDIFRYVVKAAAHQEQNDQGTFYVWDIDTNGPRAVPKDHLDTVREWAGIVGTGNVQVDEGGDTEAGRASMAVDQDSASDVV